MDEKYHYHQCVGCEEITDKETHIWNDGVIIKEATETTEGEKIYTCKICEKTKVEKIAKLPHQHKYLETYITDENYHYHQCEECEEIIDKEAHIWNDGVIIKEATETTEGEITYTCRVCGKTKVGKIVASEGIKFKLSDTENSYIEAGICGDNDMVIPAVYKGLPVTNIGGYAFNGCDKLISITITNNITNIRKYAFYGCSSLTSITIPNNVMSIGKGAFSGCSSLASIMVDKNNHTYDSRENCNAIIETSSNTLIAGCKNTVILNSVTSIGDYAFSGCSNLKNTIIPNRESISDLHPTISY